MQNSRPLSPLGEKAGVRGFVLLAALYCAATAQDDATPLSESDRSQEVAAIVNDQEILVSEVDREVAKVVKDRQVTPQALATLQAQALEQLIGRRLVIKYLLDRKLGATQQEIASATARIEKQLKKQNLTLGEYLQSTNLTEQQFRRALAWEIGWTGYLESHLTDKNLENYFNKHRREFDGTQLRVSQILLKVKSDDRRDWDAVLEEARGLRESIVSGSISFADAAKVRSQAPSAKKGGDIGLISRHEPMPESFSRIAFRLQKGDVSQPITTVFGVHLIQCTEIKPGQKPWQDVRPELRTAATRFLFDWIVNSQRKTAAIQFTGNLPHFKPGTSELVDQ